MKKTSIVAFALCLITALAFAKESQFTGGGYLNLSKRDRAALVTDYKKDAAQDGVTIQKSAVHYCRMLDTFYAKQPKMERDPLDTTLKTLIIMEYDWAEKGRDKDALAREWLGEGLYKANKERLSGIKQ